MPTEAQTAQWIRLTEGRLAPIHRSGNSLYFIQELERPPLPEPEDEQARRDLAVPQTPLVRGFQLDLETLQFSEIPVNVRPVTLPLPKPPSGGSRPPDAGVVWIFELGGVSLPRHTALGSRAVSDRFVAFTDDLDSAVWIMELATGKLSKVTADSVAGMNRDELLTQVACNPSAPLEWAQIFCDPNAGLIWTSSGLFTPDGGSLVYASNRRAYQILASAYQAGQASPSHWYWNDLWIVGIDGSNERLLYDGQGFSLVTPLGWTPDGQLVLLRYREAPDYSVSLALLNMTTGDVQNVVEGHLDRKSVV